MAARLANGTSEAGRLEILFNGEWSTVCGAGFGKKEAQVACRMLGFNSTGAADIISERYGPGADHVSVYVACQGTESSLVECILILLHSLICPTYNVGVICNITQQMSARVVNGTSDAGRLEIFFNREWSTVCNRGFGQREAKAACRMLGFNSNEAVAVSSARYGQGSDNILLQDVVCKGNETSLEECQHNVLYGGSCSHSEDIGIICNISEPMTARLVNGTSEAGRLEIFFNREWSTVCGVRFGKNEARVSCRMLGFNSTGSVAVSSDRYGQGTGYILDAGRCNGTEDSLVQCDHQGFYTSDCDSLKDVGVICNINRDKIRLTGMPRAKLKWVVWEMKVGQ
ncbi:deleted in malignant brain tumors 1 protein-like [Pomacea canaliculata]|uniref:deleted in malignant brain tumors 1 protein-like n=1 Tax=Pomacea canaliculata TaxID=400727 RepID=UPI000D72B80A|nr:deleted in malignant brain tumors 1 protein-like [Pomacea canaliculata]